MHAGNERGSTGALAEPVEQRVWNSL